MRSNPKRGRIGMLSIARDREGISDFSPPSRYDRAPASSSELPSSITTGPQYRHTIDERNWPTMLSQVSVYCTKPSTNAAMETLMNIPAEVFFDQSQCNGLALHVFPSKSPQLADILQHNNRAICTQPGACRKNRTAEAP